MGKHSDFERKPRDFYKTPIEAVHALIPHLPPTAFTYIEPCAGDGALINHLSELTIGTCIQASDIHPETPAVQQADMFETTFTMTADYIITNPPWNRKILHPMIEMSDFMPMWLLFDADWMHTKQSSVFLPRLRKIVSIGRVKWEPGSKSVGKDNAAWYLFDKPSNEPTQFYGR